MTSQKKPKKFANRRLRIESLENRELLSVTVADLPGTDYEAPNSAYVAQNSVSTNGTADVVAESTSQNAVTPNAAVIYLAKPASAKPASTVTPTTLTVYWGDPVATKAYNTDMITGFKVELLNTKTKLVLYSETINDPNLRSWTYEGLDVKTRYQVTITSVGEGASSDKAALKITATTATFPLATVKASNLTLTSATLTITDKDKVTAFVDGKTVKNYTIQYVEKTKVLDWSQAKEIPVPAGTVVADLKKCTIITEVTGLAPGVQYSFRVIATYKDGVTTESNLTAEGKAANAKTVTLPAVTVSKSFFSVISENGNDYAFSIAMNCKMANYLKLMSQFASVEFSLLVSTSTTLDKTTGQLVGAKSVDDNGFSEIDLKGVFAMNAVSLESIVAKLGREAVLGVKTLGFQLVIKFNFSDGTTTATSNSKVGKITLPSWYFPA